jgi:hypothetical protein
MEDCRAVTSQMLNEPDGSPLGLADQFEEPPLAFDQRQLAQVVAVVLDQVEGVEHRLMARRLLRRTLKSGVSRDIFPIFAGTMIEINTRAPYWCCMPSAGFSPRRSENDIAQSRWFNAGCAVTFTGPALAASNRASPIKMFDPDNDGTLDLAEVKKAASVLFAKLDPDKDGTLDARELGGRLSAKELVAADPDHDGTLDLNEYLAVVEQRFNAANPDNDGTVDAKELQSPAGRTLLRLMK